MALKLQSWQQFFLAQGLFFLGLGTGILGETWNEKTKIISWVLLGVGLGSLALSALLWALQTQRKMRKRVKFAPLPQPVSVSKNFKKLLKGDGSIDLMRGYHFTTESRILLSTHEKYTIPPFHEWVVQHMEGASIELQTGTSTIPLNAGEMLRIPLFHEERELRIAETEDTEGYQERAPRMILHKIACRNEI